MKKTVSLIFTLLLCSLIICGCGVNKPNSNGKFEKGGETYYKSGDETVHIDQVIINTEQPDINFADSTNYELYIFYSIDSEKTNKSAYRDVSIYVNNANTYSDSFKYNKKWMGEYLTGTKYEGFLNTATNYDPSKTLYGCAMIFVSQYDADHLESLIINGLCDEIDYPVGKIKKLNGFSAAKITW